MTKLEIKLKKEAIVSGLFEMGRIAAVAALPIIISQLQAGKIDWRTIIVVIVLAILKAIDKAIHEYGKAIDNDNLTLGLTRF